MTITRLLHYELPPNNFQKCKTSITTHPSTNKQKYTKVFLHSECEKKT